MFVVKSTHNKEEGGLLAMKREEITALTFPEETHLHYTFAYIYASAEAEGSEADSEK